MHHLELKIPPLIVLAIAAALMWAIARTTPQWTLLYPGRLFAAATLLLLGVAIMLIGVRAFRKASTTVDPRSPETRWQIVPEERALVGKFGAVYESYRQSVRRWL